MARPFSPNSPLGTDHTLVSGTLSGQAFTMPNHPNSSKTAIPCTRRQQDAHRRDGGRPSVVRSASGPAAARPYAGRMDQNTCRPNLLSGSVTGWKNVVPPEVQLPLPPEVRPKAMVPR